MKGGPEVPKATFFNLPEERRALVEQAALDEFAEHGFARSNINRIVSRSGIAKGSFYQYFDDKQDLYLHLIGKLAEQKIASMAPLLEAMDSQGLVDNLRALFQVGLQFADSNPQFHRLGEDFTKQQPDLMQAFLRRQQPVAQDVYQRLLASAQQRGELLPGLDLQLCQGYVQALVNQVGLSIVSLPTEGRAHVIEELLRFVARAMLKPATTGKEEQA